MEPVSHYCSFCLIFPYDCDILFLSKDDKQDFPLRIVELDGKPLSSSAELSNMENGNQINNNKKTTPCKGFEPLTLRLKV